MIVCSAVCLVALIVPCLMIRKRSSKIETGLLGAVAYGVLGYIWQYMLYMFAALYVAKMIMDGGSQAMGVALNVLLTILSSVLTAASLYWGIFLTNQKQLSIYRSATVGIGFALAKLSIDIIYPYVYSFYFSLQINAGTFQANESIQQSILQTSTPSLVTGCIKGLLLFLVIFALALIMGHYYIEKNKKMAWISVLCIYGALMLCNLIFSMLTYGNLLNAIIILVLLIFAAGASVILHHWWTKNEVIVNPLEIIRKSKK